MNYFLKCLIEQSVYKVLLFAFRYIYKDFIMITEINAEVFILVNIHFIISSGDNLEVLIIFQILYDVHEAFDFITFMIFKIVPLWQKLVIGAQKLCQEKFSCWVCFLGINFVQTFFWSTRISNNSN